MRFTNKLQLSNQIMRIWCLGLCHRTIKPMNETARDSLALKSAIDAEVESESPLLLEAGVENEGSNCNGVAREAIE